MKILHIEPLRYEPQVRQLLDKDHQVDYLEVKDKRQLIQALAGQAYEALFVRLGIAIDAEVLAAAPALKYIITPTTGLDHIDPVAAAGLKLISLKGETAFLQSIKSTSEHTWALLLSLIRKIPAAIQDVSQYFWRREPFLGMELNGKTLGIIGYGRLGTIVARYGLAFDMQVLVHDTDPTVLQTLPSGLQAVALDQLLEESDVISLHIPSNTENYHFINVAKIRQMKKGVVLINTSRGEVLEEKALLDGLLSGSIRGAAVDVIEGDSSWDHGIPDVQALLEYALKHDNLLITPHIGGYALESINSTRAFVTQKFLNELI